MNLSFSTRGWPELGWDEMLDIAVENGFSGVEVYNLTKFDPLTDRSGPFHKYQTAATVRQLKEKGLCIPCFDTSYDLAEGEECLTWLKGLMDIAGNTHVPYVAAVAAAAVMVLLMALLTVLMLWAFKTDPAGSPPLPVMALFVLVPGAVAAGVLLALRQRIREIGKGEMDDARKY